MPAERLDDTSVGLYVPLDKPAQAFSLTVRLLIRRVRDGEVRVPSFQRPLRWTGGDVVKLFDSMLKGYPIGSLLFWKHPAPAEIIRIGNAELPVPEVQEAWYIVDGQQRVTALAAALLDLDHDGDLRWLVHFDPTTRRFLSGPLDTTTLGRLVPLSALGDLRRLNKWFRTCELSEEEQGLVEDVQQRILDYDVPAYLMDTSDRDALRGVFARLNSTGVRMRADEVFHALLGAEASDLAARAGRVDLLELQAACDLDGFGQPPRPEVLKALLAINGLDPSRRLDAISEDAMSSWVSAEEVAEALRRTVAFLQASAEFTSAEPGAGIPAYSLIPYPVAFVILARWFYLFPEPDPVTRRQLSRWLWRGVAGGVHQRAAVSKLRYQVRELRPDDMEGSLRKLLEAVGERPLDPWPMDSFHAHHAASRVEVLTMLAKNPRDRSGPVSWRALLGSGERVAREVVRSTAWNDLTGEAKRLVRSAANRVLLDARHTGLRTELVRWQWPRDREALESHLIDEHAFAALRDNDIAEFLRHRAERIRQEVTAFLAQRAGIGEPLLMPVESYFDSPDELDDGGRS